MMFVPIRAPFLVPSLLAFAVAAPLLSQGGPLDALRFEAIVSGVSDPTSIADAHDGSGRLFITEQRGRIVIAGAGALFPLAFLDIQDRAAFISGEQGLLGLAFHPNYSENGFFFVDYTDFNGNTVVSRYRVSGDPDLADRSSEKILLRIEQPFSNHNGGQLQFGPDGYLYISTGDGGAGGDPGNRAQSLGVLLGKILRIDVDNGAPFAIPESNPFVGRPGARPEIWAYGLRNPWRFSFDRRTGDMLIGDVGQDEREEIDFEAAESAGGMNFGWRRMEGGLCFNPANNCNDGTLTLPILEYGHSGRDCSVTGGYRYRGATFPQLDGVYFFGDFCSGNLYAGIEQDGAAALGLPRAAEGEDTVRQGAPWRLFGPLATRFSISTFGEDEAGELYLADFGDGTIYRITTDPPAPALSALSPDSATAGGLGFTLRVTGRNFTPASAVRWGGRPRPTTFFSATRLEAAISAADIAAPGAVLVQVATPGGGTTSPVAFVVEIGIQLSPRINQGGVVSAASFAAGAGLAPGSIASVFGVDLAVGVEGAIALPLLTTLAGATFTFDLRFEAGIFFGSPLQANIQIPWELEGAEQASLAPVVAGNFGPALEIPLARVSPAIFTIDQSGTGQGSVLISGTASLAAPQGTTPGARPARLGEFLEIFATGLGPVTNTPPSGAAAGSNPISVTVDEVIVTVGVEPVKVFFAGLAPGFVGLYQVNIGLAGDLPSGSAVTLTITLNGVNSNPVTIAIE